MSGVLQPSYDQHGHHERRAPPFGQPDKLWGGCDAPDAQPGFDINLHIFDRSPLATIPNCQVWGVERYCNDMVIPEADEREKGNAWLLLYWIKNRIEGKSEPVADEKWSWPVWYFCSVALLPGIAMLSDRYIRMGWSKHLLLLGKLQLGAIAEQLDSYVNDETLYPLLAHVYMGYRRKHFSRIEFETMLKSTKWSRYASTACRAVANERLQIACMMRTCLDEIDAEVASGPEDTSFVTCNGIKISTDPTAWTGVNSQEMKRLNLHPLEPREAHHAVIRNPSDENASYHAKPYESVTCPYRFFVKWVGRGDVKYYVLARWPRCQRVYTYSTTARKAAVFKYVPPYLR